MNKHNQNVNEMPENAVVFEQKMTLLQFAI